MISQANTVKDIAKHYAVTDRSVRNWLKDARKDLGIESLGSYEKGRLVFSPDEVEILAGYGSKVAGSEPVTEILTPELEPDQIIDINPKQSQAPALVMFNIQNVTIQSRRTDTTALDTEADQLLELTQRAFAAISQDMADDLIGCVRTAKAQNRHAILGAQAAASTAAVKEL